MSLAGLSLRDLEYVCAVADHLHFGRAAAACGVSQPALSGQVRKIEALLQLTLFERDHRRVVVTRRGQALVRQARRVLAEARRLIDLARDMGEPLAGPFALGAIATLGPYLFPHLLAPLRERFPRVELTLREARTAELLEALETGDLDAALLSLPVRKETLATAPAFFEPFLVVHGPAHRPAVGRPLTVEGLPAERMLLLDEGHCLRDQALALCGTLGAAERRHATGLETLRHMVAAGAGYSILPALAATPHPMLDGMVRYTPFDDPAAGRTVALVWRVSDPRRDQFELLARLVAEIAPAPACACGPASSASRSARTPSHRSGRS
jgi:LysR family hydrogen peroxide-inducible transcriptional activator